MDFSYTAEEEAFREEVRAFIHEHKPDLGGGAAEDAATAFAKLPLLFEWNRKLYERGWVGFTWPAEYGGGGGDVMQQFILKTEMAKHNAPPLGISMMGLAWVGPSILQYGTEEQKQQHIPPILKGELQWCTGYSEPGSGSDLASLQCRGEIDGDDYVVNGQKIWTSLAMWAQWMILLVRTDTTGAKQEGITCLLVPMDLPGITVNEIREMNGGAMFGEVFFRERPRAPRAPPRGGGAGVGRDQGRPGPRAILDRGGDGAPAPARGPDRARPHDQAPGAPRHRGSGHPVPDRPVRGDGGGDAAQRPALPSPPSSRASPWAPRPRSTSFSGPRWRSRSGSWGPRSRGPTEP